MQQTVTDATTADDLDVVCWCVVRDRKLPDGKMLRAENLSPLFDSEEKADEQLAKTIASIPNAYIGRYTFNFNGNDPVRDQVRRQDLLNRLQ